MEILEAQILHKCMLYTHGLPPYIRVNTPFRSTRNPRRTAKNFKAILTLTSNSFPAKFETLYTMYIHILDITDIHMCEHVLIVDYPKSTLLLFPASENFAHY